MLRRLELWKEQSGRAGGWLQSLLPVLALTGCDGPSIETCWQGAFYADCGGLGVPTYACEGEDCRWFVGGNVAANFEASSCAPKDVCCHEGSPFARSPQLSNVGGDQLFYWGKQPWDATREMNLTVLRADDIEVRAFVCEEDEFASSDGCPVQVAEDAALALVRDTITVFPTKTGWAFYGWTPIIEIDPKLGKARICAGSFTDIYHAGCPRAGQPMSDFMVCASSGTVRLSQNISPDGSGADSIIGLLVEVDVLMRWACAARHNCGQDAHPGLVLSMRGLVVAWCKEACPTARVR